jgi:hypothetical protein
MPRVEKKNGYQLGGCHPAENAITEFSCGISKIEAVACRINV